MVQLDMLVAKDIRALAQAGGAVEALLALVPMALMQQE
jgi:hypothetical protein